MCVRSTPLGPADVLGRVRARRLQPDFSGKWYSDSPSRPGRIRGHGILFFLSLAHFRTLLVTEESGVTLLTCQRLSVATSPRARRSRRWDPSPSLHRTHYGLLDDGRARPTPWSSDLKLGRKYRTSTTDRGVPAKTRMGNAQLQQQAPNVVP